MRNIFIGLAVGAGAGILDVIPMIIQQLSWDANISAFSMWVVAGVFIATSEFRLHGAFKGLLVAFLTLLPTAVLIGWKEPLHLIPIGIMTALLGCLSGFTIEKWKKK